MSKRKAPKRKVRSLTPFLDKLEEVKRTFVADEKDIEDLENTRASPLDLYFMEVAEKHGIDLSNDDWDYDA